MSRNFIIYYGDGSTFVGLPEDAPTQNVQCIAWNDPVRGILNTGRVVLHDWDFYIWTDRADQWIGTNKYHDIIRHVQDGGVRNVIEGKWINRLEYLAIKERAWNDPRLNKKSAVDSSENGEE